MPAAPAQPSITRSARAVWAAMTAHRSMPQLRVRGVEGLRVIDASAMPAMVSGITYAATSMIAEKSVDDLLRSRHKTIFCERKPIDQ